jgi:hypothetical protein
MRRQPPGRPQESEENAMSATTPTRSQILARSFVWIAVVVAAVSACTTDGEDPQPEQVTVVQPQSSEPDENERDENEARENEREPRENEREPRENEADENERDESERGDDQENEDEQDEDENENEADENED